MSMTNPITPPPELVQQWEEQFLERPTINGCFIQSYIATQSAQWGADQELEAVEEEIIAQGWFANSVHRRAQLRAARRPKPPSLKEQALEALKRQSTRSVPSLVSTNDCDTIRRALEALPND